MKIYVVVWNKHGMYQLEKAFTNTEDAYAYKENLIDKLPEYYHDYHIEEIELNFELKAEENNIC